MTKLGRRAIYGDTCAAPNCTEPRHVLNSKGTPSRSRLCDRHYREDMAARRSEQLAVQPAPTGYTVADAYKLWETNGMPPTFVYKRRQVYGIKLCAAGYTLVLAGADEPQWVAETTRLEVAT